MENICKVIGIQRSHTKITDNRLILVI